MVSGAVDIRALLTYQSGRREQGEFWEKNRPLSVSYRSSFHFYLYFSLVGLVALQWCRNQEIATAWGSKCMENDRL